MPCDWRRSSAASRSRRRPRTPASSPRPCPIGSGARGICTGRWLARRWSSGVPLRHGLKATSAARSMRYAGRMATTLTSILVHATFSTKERRPIIPADLLPDLFAYGGGICRDMKSPLLHAGGVEDHVHLLLSLGKTEAISEVMM